VKAYFKESHDFPGDYYVAHCQVSEVNLIYMAFWELVLLMLLSSGDQYYYTGRCLLLHFLYQWQQLGQNLGPLEYQA
jgi:hypothetical protein